MCHHMRGAFTHASRGLRRGPRGGAKRTLTAGCRRRRLMGLLAAMGVFVFPRAEENLYAAVPAARSPSPPTLGEPVTVAWSAHTIADAASLLADKLRLSVVVVAPVGDWEPPAATAPAAPTASGQESAPVGAAKGGRPVASRPVGTTPQRARRETKSRASVTLRLDARPLRELLDAIAAAFNYTWEEVAGVYVFRVRESVEAAGDAIVREVKERAPSPDQDALAELAQRLDARATAEAVVAFRALDPPDQELLGRVLLNHLLQEFTRALGMVVDGGPRLDNAARVTIESFAGGGRLLLSLPTPEVLQLQVWVPSPAKPGSLLGVTWVRRRAEDPRAGNQGAEPR